MVLKSVVLCCLCEGATTKEGGSHSVFYGMSV